MKPIYLFLFLPFLLGACQSDKTQESSIPVYHAGALHKIMQEGDISAKLDLDSLVNRPNLFGLGPAENLKGEILIWGSKAYLTTVAGSGLATYNGFRKKAALLVYSEVARWDSLVLPPTISDLVQLEPFLEESAAKAGINTDAPFPFLLIGQPKVINWHVIDWDVNDPVHTHEKHQQAGMKSGWKDTPTEILGFYSQQPGLFTHMGSKIHLHVTTPDRRLVAHLDGANGIEGMVLYLPKIE
ncbi:MAG: hypothetical protein R2828_16470 [Saprospiraceae bacterium]